MKIVYLSNLFHHLQKPLSDELYRLTDGAFHFVEMSSMQKGMPYKGEKADYVISYDDNTSEEVKRLIADADAVICGEAPLSLVKERYLSGKLTFRDDERRYKKVNRYLKWPVYTYNSLYFNKGYLLCASAYSSRDYHLSGMSLDKCLKWGYFPAVKEYDDVEKLIDAKGQDDGRIRIFWVGRLIDLKHPESVIVLASGLKEEGYSFQIKIAGGGPQKEHLERLIEEKKLTGAVQLLGMQSPEAVRSLMEEADIYLFTSDRAEGWGAVLNESMNSACAVVSSPAPGAAPFLIKDGQNGLFFKDHDWLDMSRKVMWLIDHPAERRRIAREAYNTMVNLWSPEVAAGNLVSLIQAVMDGRKPEISDGPCSKAEYLSQGWYKGGDVIDY